MVFLVALGCASGFFVVLWGLSLFVFLQGSGLLMVPQRSFLLYGIIRGSSLFYGVLRVSSGFPAVLRRTSGFLVILRCSSGFLVVLGLLRVAKLFCGVTRRSGFLPRQLL